MSDSDNQITAATGDAPVAAAVAVGPSWAEQDGVLRDMWLQNKSPQDIAATLSRSVAAIMTRAARLGLPRRAAPGRKPGGTRSAEGAVTVRTAVPRAASRGVADENAAPQTSARICLMCLRSFQSQGRHNRICPSCKNSSEYESASSIPDIHLPV